MLAVRQGWLAAFPVYEQQVNFATTSDGVRIAYAAVGEGPPVVIVLGWFTHLESGLSSPGRNPFVPTLLEGHQVVMYDGRGFGLSDRGLDDYSLEARVRDLEAVVDALGLERFGIVALSAGGSAAIAFAALHPERVSRLYLYGTFVRMSEESRSQIRSLVPLVRSSWGQDNPAFRQVFTSLFMPEADEFTMRLFNDMQRVAATPSDAAAFLDTLVDVDARAYAPRVKAPTLVSHLRGDAIVPFESGREVASLIPGARLLSIEGKNHAFLLGDPAAKIIRESMREFHAAGSGSGEENP
jgi:pimeloyl-ACP methyl ester carboxylesterase